MDQLDLRDMLMATGVINSAIVQHVTFQKPAAILLIEILYTLPIFAQINIWYVYIHWW